jgi:hypothetical protein
VLSILSIMRMTAKVIMRMTAKVALLLAMFIDASAQRGGGTIGHSISPPPTHNPVMPARPSGVVSRPWGSTGGFIGRRQRLRGVTSYALPYPVYTGDWSYANEVPWEPEDNAGREMPYVDDRGPYVDDRGPSVDIRGSGR